MKQFWDKVDQKGPDECWNWIASTNNGYGQICVNYKVIRAHRLAFWLIHGRPPKKGLCITHTCDNKKCVNPAHLVEQTQAQNVREAMDRGLLNKRKGRRLNCLQVKKIRDLCSSDMKIKDIADEFNISATMVHKIKSGQAWV